MNTPFPTIEGYELRGVIGRGGAATIYEAHDDRHGRSVAIKIINGESLNDSQQRAFRRELRAMGRLGDHPNVVTVHNSGFLPDGRPYLIMPLFADGTISARVRSQGPLPVEEVLALGVKIAGALGTAHRRGILHCDIKPTNLSLIHISEPTRPRLSRMPSSA